MVEGGGLENRRAQAPGVRIPLPPSSDSLTTGVPLQRRGAGWYAGYAALTITPPAGFLLGREVTGHSGAARVREDLQARALALQAGEQLWLLIVLDASLLCPITAAAIRAGLEHEGRAVTVVATGCRGGPVLAAGAHEPAYRHNVIAVTQAAAALALQHSSRAMVSCASAAFEADEQPQLTNAPRLPYLDLLRISPGVRRPEVVIAVTALPRLVDAAEGLVARGPWSSAERLLAAERPEGLAILGLTSSHAQEADPALQHAGREEPLAARLTSSLLQGLGQRGQPLVPRLEVDVSELALETLPLPDGYAARRAADQAEIGCQDGTLAERQQQTARWEWLERVYRWQMAGRSPAVQVPITRVRLGQATVVGVGADLSESAVVRLLEPLDEDPVLVVAGANGRAGAVVAQPQRPTLRGAREVEPCTDLWPFGPRAVSSLVEHLVS